VSLTTFDLPRYMRRAGTVVLFNTLVGLGLGLARGGGWVQQMVYAQAIGLCIWAFIDFGRLLFERNPDSHLPTGWRGVVLQVGGVTLGYFSGTWLADLYCGCSTFEHWAQSPRTIGGYFVMAVGVSAGISYFFTSRGREVRRRQQLAVAQRDAAEARLKLLESQLEPHMLFNTLANLRVLIGLDAARAQAMLDQLIAFLRATLSASRTAMHPLSSEFERVADYLELMKVRMGERLVVELSLPQTLAAQPVPPLILQPLVENAIKHGLEPHVAGGRLDVDASAESGQLVLRVRDNGAGLAASGGTSGTRFGLQQVRERLRALYGDAASLSLAPGDAGGTLAVVRLPLAPHGAADHLATARAFETP
jgi:signal transduction histidine kinase